MNVGQLVEALKKFDPQATVVIEPGGPDSAVCIRAIEPVELVPETAGDEPEVVIVLACSR